MVYVFVVITSLIYYICDFIGDGINNSIYLTEGFISNVFIINSNGDIMTCVDNHVLPGSMSKIVKLLCKYYDIKVIDSDMIDIVDVLNWDGMFITNSVKKIIPVDAVVIDDKMMLRLLNKLNGKVASTSDMRSMKMTMLSQSHDDDRSETTPSTTTTTATATTSTTTTTTTTTSVAPLLSEAYTRTTTISCYNATDKVTDNIGNSNFYHQHHNHSIHYFQNKHHWIVRQLQNAIDKYHNEYSNYDVMIDHHEGIT